MAENLEDIEGVISSVIYYNEETCWCIASLQTENLSCTVKGVIVNVREGEHVNLSGNWILDPRYGKQFQISYFRYITPSSVQGIYKYLSSGLIPGIGPVYAKKLVDAFGEKTLEIIENQPQKLYDIGGIGKVRVSSIIDSWQEQKVIRDVMVFLRTHGIGEQVATRIYKTYGYKAMEVLQKDPWILCREIQGVGFLTADKIAISIGFDKESVKRVRAGLVHVLQEALEEGDCWLFRDEVLVRGVNLLGIDCKKIDSSLDEVISAELLTEKEGRIFLRMVDRIEDQVAIRLITLLLAPFPALGLGASEMSSKIHDFLLSDGQIQALKNSVSSKISIITGGPGVGKTTVLSTLVRLFETKSRHVILAAPTGKASRRMETAAKHPASTIHRLLGYNGKDFIFNEENPLDGDIFILDETSMVDLFLFHSFLKALPLHAVLILVGDVDQLPSVGPGKILFDLIECKLIPVTFLIEIFRQKEGSAIIDAAHAVNRGEFFDTNSADFFFIDSDSSLKTRTILEKMLSERIPKKFEFHPVLDCQVLAPMYKGEAGIDRLNQWIQNLLNPSSPGLEIFGREIREGDKVMQLENDYDKEVFNGDQGIVQAVNFSNKSLTVRFEDGRVVNYEKGSLDQLTLSYVASVHKVQGSEFPCVIVIMENSHHVMLQKSLLYTAMTRGKQLVILLGQRKAFEKAVKNTSRARRNTFLIERLCKWHELSKDSNVCPE